jgi:hypothetical protein
MVQRKQPWSLDAATALELFYEDITEADLEKFKVIFPTITGIDHRDSQPRSNSIAKTSC